MTISTSSARWRLIPLLASALVLALAISLTACSGSSEGGPPPAAPMPEILSTVPSGPLVIDRSVPHAQRPVEPSPPHPASLWRFVQEFRGPLPADRAALMALYAATDGPNWADNTNWGSTAPLFRWSGVTTNADGRVTGLALFKNNLTGLLPDALADLTYLRELWLYDNHLYGAIPAWLGDLAGLESLGLSNNNFRGPIPAELGRLANLEGMGLDGNELRGEIPTALGDLAHLEILALGGNQLSGSIPAALGDLANLQGLGLSHNQLSGEIPAALGSLSHLQQLYLTGNQLSGPIPPAVGYLANLRELLLSQNRFRGPIPAALGTLTSLRWLDLSHNQLQGPIPATLGDLAKLETLDLSHNQLDGSIPAALRALSDLSSFRLGDNALSGCVPNSFHEWHPGGDFTTLGLPFCRLRDLQLRGALLDPPFADGTAAYTATVPGDVEEILMTAAVHDTRDTVMIRKDGESYTEGMALPLDLGSNPITVEVMPSDGTPSQIVTVTVTWEPAESHAPGSVVLTLRLGGDFYIVPAGVSTMAADLFGDTNVTSVWTYTDGWGWIIYEPSTGAEDFLIEAGDVLWIVAPSVQMLPVVVPLRSDAPPMESGAITLPPWERVILLAVPAGAPTTAAGLFGATDVTIAWKYNRATRTWDLSYLPALGCDGAIAPGDVLWVVKPIEQFGSCGTGCGA